MGCGRLRSGVYSHADLRGDPYSRGYSEAGIQGATIQAGAPGDIDICGGAFGISLVIGAEVGLGQKSGLRVDPIVRFVLYRALAMKQLTLILSVLCGGAVLAVA